MANSRVYYAIQQVSFGKNSSGGAGARHVAHGVQSVGITTTFNLEQVFELGQLAIYENVEGTPDIEVTMTKAMDGYIPLYCMATADQTAGPQLAKRALPKGFVQLGIWDEANESAGQNSSTAKAWVEMSGLFVSSLTYNFPLDDWFTEDITLVGNVKVWGTGQSKNEQTSCYSKYYPSGKAGAFASNEDSPPGSGGVNRRENLVFASTQAQTDDPDYSVMPQDIDGIGTSGQIGTAHIQSMTVSADIAREDLFELGKKIAYARPVTFPVEVTCDIETTTSSGDLVDAIDECRGSSYCSEAWNLMNRKIRIASCEGLRIYLGLKNKLASVTYGGGDAAGGNATVTYSYSTFNDFTVLHPADDNGSGGSASGQAWWGARGDYLGKGLNPTQQT